MEEEDQGYTDLELLRGMYKNERLIWNLVRAQMHSYEAMNEIYKPEGSPIRGFWYRWRLSRAQNTLMTLVVKELTNKRERKDPA